MRLCLLYTECFEPALIVMSWASDYATKELFVAEALEAATLGGFRGICGAGGVATADDDVKEFAGLEAETDGFHLGDTTVGELELWLPVGPVIDITGGPGVEDGTGSGRIGVADVDIKGEIEEHNAHGAAK